MQKFYKIAFYVQLFVIVSFIWIFNKANPMNIEGASSWIDLYSTDSDATVKFLEENFGIKAEKSVKSALNTEYRVIEAGGSLWPFAGVMQVDGKDIKSSTLIYLTVKNYDAAHKKILAAGAKARLANQTAGGMKFGIYAIPGGLDIGIAEYAH